MSKISKLSKYFHKITKILKQNLSSSITLTTYKLRVDLLLASSSTTAPNVVIVMEQAVNIILNIIQYTKYAPFKAIWLFTRM